MRLYIANPTPQPHEFAFRTSKAKKVIYIPIQAGGQVVLPLDFDTEDAQSIIQHHSQYGMLAVTDLKKLPTRAGHNIKVPLIFSIDKQIPVPLIAKVIQHNEAATAEINETERQAAAAAAAQRLQAFKDEQQMPFGELKEFEIETIETRPSVSQDGKGQEPKPSDVPRRTRVGMDRNKVRAEGGLVGR